MSTRIPFVSGDVDQQYNTHNHKFITTKHHQLGNTFGIQRDGKPVLFVRELKTARQVLLSDEFGKTWDSEDVSGEYVDYVMNLIQPMLKRTIFNMHSDENLTRRTILRPLFQEPEIFVASIELAIINEMQMWPSRGVVDIQHLAHNLIKTCMLTVLCGEFAHLMRGCLPTFHHVMSYFVHRYATPCHDQVITTEDDAMMRQLLDASLVVVSDYRNLLEKSCHTAPVTKYCMLYIYMTNGYSDHEMAATFVNVMIAAGEAPGSVLAQLVQQLGHSQGVQTRVYQEVDRVAARGRVSMHLDKLEFTNAVVLEATRLFAPATLVQRTALEDTVLQGITVNKGTIVGICPTAVHANSETWACPHSFNPDREEQLYIMSPGLLTFSKGPRGCPGKHLATAILNMALAKLVQQFMVTPAAGYTGRTVPKMVQWSVDGIPVTLHKRYPHISNL